MNVFAGNLLVEPDVKVELGEFDYVESFSKTGKKIIYVFGETEMKNSQELIDFFTEKLGKINSHDMSISTENAIGVVPYDYESGVYECCSFAGENVGFEEIADRFEDVEGVFAIREAEDSQLFGNKVVKVDFIY